MATVIVMIISQLTFLYTEIVFLSMVKKCSFKSHFKLRNINTVERIPNYVLDGSTHKINTIPENNEL